MSGGRGPVCECGRGRGGINTRLVARSFFFRRLLLFSVTHTPQRAKGRARTQRVPFCKSGWVWVVFRLCCRRESHTNDESAIAFFCFPIAGVRPPCARGPPPFRAPVCGHTRKHTPDTEPPPRGSRSEGTRSARERRPQHTRRHRRRWRDGTMATGEPLPAAPPDDAAVPDFDINSALAGTAYTPVRVCVCVRVCAVRGSRARVFCFVGMLGRARRSFGLHRRPPAALPPPLARATLETRISWCRGALRGRVREVRRHAANRVPPAE